MEDIKLDQELRLCDMKEENLRKKWEKLSSTASDVLMLNIQWSDLEDHLKSLRETVEKRYREVVSNEVELRNLSFALEERVKVVEAAEAEMVDFEMKSNVFRSEAEERGKELCVLRKLLEECSEEHRSKTSQVNELLELLRKTHVDFDLKGEQLRQMETDLERYHVKVNIEKEHLDRIENDRRELEADIERKKKDLTLVMDKITECEQLYEKKSSELRKMTIDLQRQRDEISSEREHLDKSRAHSRELEQEIEEKMKDHRKILDQIAESGKQLKLTDNQLESQQKLFETRSAELIKIQTEIELKGKQLEQMDFVLDRQRDESSSELEHLHKSQCRTRELDEEIEQKTSRIAEYEKQLKSVEEQLACQQELLEKQTLELVSKKKETCHQLKSKNKELEEIEGLIQERTGRNESIELLLQEHSEELASKEKRQNEITEAVHKLSLEIVSKEKTIQQLSEKQHSKQKKLDLIDAKFVLKEKELCSVKDTYRECLQNWEIKKEELKSLEEEVKKIKESLTDFQSKEAEQHKLKASLMEREKELELKEKKLEKSLEEEVKKIKEISNDFQAKEVEQVKSKASLMEREKELGLKEKQFRARSENIELKEKKLDAREERLNKKDEQLKSAEQKVAKCVKDYELKAKKLASFCQQNKPDQQVDLARDASVRDEKTLQLLLHGHLRKCHTLHLDVLSALKASSDPAKLVLVTIQGLHERMVVAKLEPDSVYRSSVCLLECLMNISPEPKTDLIGEAIESAAEWKNKTLVKADNQMEALGFLHFLAAFSVAYTFDADKVHCLFDDAFLRQYVPSIFNNLLSSLDGNPEQQPSEAPIRNSTDSCSHDFQEIIASSHLGNDDTLLEPEGSAYFSPNEIVTGLQNMKDPARCVLTLVNDELMNAQRRGEASLTEPIVKNLVSLLEELPRVVESSKHLLSEALQVAHRWQRMLNNSSQMSPLEVWGFLQLIVAYELVYRTNRDSTLRFALSVAHFKQAPKLFESLGLRYAIKDLVTQLLEKRHFLLAVRFILYFNLDYNFTSLKILKDEIVTLRLSAKDKRRFNSQAEAAKLKDIIELIEDFKLEIDLPVELIVKFMVPRETQNQNPYAVSSSLPVQPTFPAILGGSPTQQVLQLETYQAGGSTVVHGQSSHQAGHKRPRMDPSVSGHVIRPCFNQSGYDRF